MLLLLSCECSSTVGNCRWARETNQPIDRCTVHVSWAACVASNP